MRLIDVDVIAPNLKRRLSGVTATVVHLVPRQAKQINIAVTGPGLPDHLPHISFWKMFLLPRDRMRVWHARRNTDMLWGVVLKHIFRRRLHLMFTSSSPRRRGRWTNFLTRRMQRIVATNQKNADVMPGVPVIIPHGVDTDIFTPGSADVFELGQAQILGCFGRVRAKKGTDVFVKALTQVLPEFPTWGAVILGRIKPEDQNFADELKSALRAGGVADQVHFVRELSLDRMPDAYRSLDIFVAPSLLEGFGLTPFEAMACGVPTIASDGVGAFSDGVTDGATGALFEAGNAEALAAAMRRLMSEAGRLDDMGKAARSKMVQQFSLTQEADALVTEYKTLLALS